MRRTLILLIATTTVGCSNANDGSTTTTTNMDATGSDAASDAATTTADATSGGDTAVDTRDLSGVVINEVDARGTPDWVELLNTSGEERDLSGVFLTDDAELEPQKYALPAGTTLAAGAYLVVDISDETTGFKLGSDEAFAVVHPGTGAIVDATDWAEGDALEGKSWGRIPNGAGDFKTMDTPTPGAANVDNATVTPVGSIVVLNELNATTDEIELYNAGDEAADLSGLYIGDDGYLATPETPDMTQRFDLSGTLEPGAFLVLIKDTDHTFGLGKSDSVTLFDGADDVVLDITTWVEPDAEASWCRINDTFQVCSQATLGEANVE